MRSKIPAARGDQRPRGKRFWALGHHVWPLLCQVLQPGPHACSQSSYLFSAAAVSRGIPATTDSFSLPYAPGTTAAHDSTADDGHLRTRLRQTSRRRTRAVGSVYGGRLAPPPGASPQCCWRLRLPSAGGAPDAARWALDPMHPGVRVRSLPYPHVEISSKFEVLGPRNGRGPTSSKPLPVKIY